MVHVGQLCVRPFVHPSVHQLYIRPSVHFSFPDDNLSKHQWIFTKLAFVCALILWRSGLGLLMCKFHQIFTELSARDRPTFSFTDDNLSKRQWIFTKLDMCILWRSGLGLLMGKFHQILTDLSAQNTPIFSFSGR